MLGEYVDSGYREPRARLRYSLRSNARYQLMVLCCAIAGLIYISIQNGFNFVSIKSLAMVLAYVWGLVLAIYLMGHGLVSIPRKLFRNSNVSGSLRRLQAHAPKVHDRLLDAVNDLESLEGQVAQLQQRKTGSALEFRDWIEELDEPYSSPEARPMLSHAPDSSSAKPPPVITERYLADLTRRLQRARHQRARFVDEWARVVQSAADMQAIINSSASKRLQFTPVSSAGSSSFFRKVSFLTPYMRYQVYVRLLPTLRFSLGMFFTAASVLIVWSELTKSFAPKLSIVSLTVVPHLRKPGPIGFGGQVVASAWLLYLCAAAMAGVHDAQIWGNRALVRRNTYGESACWYASLVARLTVPIAYNFMTSLPEATHKETTFYQFLGRLIEITRLGNGFVLFFPAFILLPILATLFNLYGKIKSIFGFDLSSSDEDVENDAAGYGLGGWREGRDLIDQELNGMGPLAFASGPSRPTRPTRRGRRESEAQASSTSTLTTPSPDGIRPTRSSRGAATYSAATLEDENEQQDETFLQSFVHRVKNTLDTTNKPQWLQGGLPRWMGGESNEQNGGITGLFAGRPSGVRLG